MNNNDKGIIEICALFALLFVSILRPFCNNPSLMTTMSLISIFIALWDIYKDVEKEYNHFGRRFLIFRGVLILLYIILLAIVIATIMGKVQFNDIQEDEITILVLLLCLPKDFYIHLIGLLIKGRDIK